MTIMAVFPWISANVCLKTVTQRHKNEENVKVNHYSFFCVPPKGQGESLMTTWKKALGAGGNN